MVNWRVVFSRQAEKDKKLLKAAGLEQRARELLRVIAEDPYKNPPPYEKLVGDLSGFISRRINIQHRLVYKVIPATTDDGLNGTVKVLRMWSHYE